MKVRVEPLNLELKTPFRIAHGTSTTRRNALVRLGGRHLGEGALPPYYPYSLEDVQAYLGALDAGSWLEGDSFFLEDALDRLPPGPPPARAALDMALHDYWGKQLGQPLYRLWGLNPNRAPASAITLSLPDSPGALRQQVRQLAAAAVIKLKLGAGSLQADEELVRTARQETDAALGLDANGAWSVEEAAQVIPRLAEYDLAYIEQPISGRSAGDWPALRQALPDDLPPLIADESVQTARDVLDMAGAADGINVKLAKAGGLRAARRMITLARALDLQVMLGCMIESSVALTAAAHLAPLADFLDLDGHLHLARDPFEGVAVRRGRLQLPARPGLGVKEKEAPS